MTPDKPLHHVPAAKIEAALNAAGFDAKAEHIVSLEQMLDQFGSILEALEALEQLADEDDAAAA